jgi:spore maturation protein CgeB
MEEKFWVMIIHSPYCFDTSRYMIKAFEQFANVVDISFGIDSASPIQTMVLDKNASVFRRWWIKKPLSKFVSRFMKSKPFPVNFDLIFLEDPARLDLSQFNAKKSYYAIDVHLTDDYFTRMNLEDYDFVFVAQKDYVHKFSEHGCKNVFWLPLACDPDYHKRYNVPIEYDVCFVGRSELKEFRDKGGRVEMLQHLSSKYKTYVGRAYLHDMALAYSKSKIVFNKSIKGDLNMRVFEGLGCGRMVLTDNIGNGLNELFENRKHLVTYNDLHELLEMADYYLQNAEEREKIAVEGQKEAYMKHTYTERAKFVLSKTLGF